jgi:hypothetical protein
MFRFTDVLRFLPATSPKMPEASGDYGNVIDSKSQKSQEQRCKNQKD